MSFRYTAARSSRVTKSTTKNPLLRRATSSPFSNHARRKPIDRSKSDMSEMEQGDDEDQDETLQDSGLVICLGGGLDIGNVLQAIKHIQSSMFSELPERAGMNSVRIAEVLNFRRGLPPVVSVAHLHILLPSPTSTEKEVADLVRVGKIRRIVIAVQGPKGAIEEGMVRASDWHKHIEQSAHLEDGLKEKFRALLDRYPAGSRLSRGLFTAEEATSLIHAGYLTLAGKTGSVERLFSNGSTSKGGYLGSLATRGAVSASGSLAASGGEGAVHEAGGSGGGRLAQTNQTSRQSGSADGNIESSRTGDNLDLTLPGMGSYLKLLASATTQLLSLLSRSKSRQAPMTTLKERWDGGVAGDDEASRRRKFRGEYAGILPGRTRKWKQYNGLSFEWVLEECVGRGLVEVFETGSVGKGVRRLG